MTDEVFPSCNIPEDNFAVLEQKYDNSLEMKPFHDFSIKTLNMTKPISPPNDACCGRLNRPNIAEISSKSSLEHKLANSAFSPQKRRIGFELLGNLGPEKKKSQKNKFFKTMSIYFYVKKITRKMRECSNVRNWKILEPMHYELFNDFFNYQSKNPVCHTEKISEIFGKVILPTNKLRLFWDFIQILINLHCFGIIPLSMGFNMEIINNFESMRILFIILFAFDFIINFNTAFYSKGELIVSKKLIMKNYLKTLFVYDFFSLSFLIMNGILGFSIENNLVKVCSFLFLFRFRNLSKAISNFEDFLFIDEKTDNILGFVKLIFTILLFSHWSACIWIFIGKMEETSSWIIYYGLKHESYFKQYVNALYYIVVVINTVGFGDFVSTNTIERGFTIIFIFIACVIFGITLNRIGMILQNINRSRRELKRSLNLINGFMKSKNIDFNLKIKIKNYLEYIWQEERKNKTETQEIINKLSKSLREELLLNANGRVIKETQLLNRNFSEATLSKIVSEMHELNLTPGDLIFSENEVSDNNLYIIRDGEIDLYLEGENENKRMSLKILRKGDFFGEKSFFCGIPNLSCARSVSFSSLFIIKKEDFLRALKENPADFERFCQIRDQINLSDDNSRFYLNCDSCKSLNHSIFNCPLLHLILSKKRIIERTQNSLPQVRIPYVRKREKKMLNSFSNFNKIKRKAVRFTEDLQAPRDDDSNDESGSLEYLNSISFAEKEETIPNLNAMQDNGEHAIRINSKIESDTDIKKLKEIENSGIRKNPEGVSELSPAEIKKMKESTVLSSYGKMNNSMNSIMKRTGESRKSFKEKSKKEISEDKSGKPNSMNTCPSFDQFNSKVEHMNLLDRMSFDVDTAKIYYDYYPEFNFDEIAEKINKSHEKKIKKLKCVFNFLSSHNSINSQQNLRFSKLKKRQTEVSSFANSNYGPSNGTSKSKLWESSRKTGFWKNSKKQSILIRKKKVNKKKWLCFKLFFDFFRKNFKEQK